MGERNEDEHCLTEDLVPLVLWHELDRTAVVQTVSKLDQDYTHIVIEREEDSLEILCLHAFLCGLVFIVEHGLDLSKTFHDGCDLISEQAAQILYSVVGVFYHIVKEGGDDRLVSQSYVADHYLCDSNRMKYIWLAGASSDTLVSFIGKFKGLLDLLEFVFAVAAFSCSFLQVGIVSCYDLVIILVEFRNLTHNTTNG